MSSSVAFDTSNKQNQDNFIKIFISKIVKLDLYPWTLVNFTEDEIKFINNFGYRYLVNMLILFDAEHFLNMDFSCLYKYMLIVKKEKDIEN